MPVFFVILGVFALVVAVRDKGADARKLLASELTGPGNFLSWVLAILLIGSLGYVPQLRAFSRAFLALVMLSILLSKKGFFSQLQSQLLNRTAAPVADAPGNTGASVAGAGAAVAPAPSLPAYASVADLPGGWIGNRAPATPASPAGQAALALPSYILPAPR